LFSKAEKKNLLAKVMPDGLCGNHSARALCVGRERDELTDISSGVLKLLYLPGHFPPRERATLEMPPSTPPPFFFQMLLKAEQRALPQAT